MFKVKNFVIEQKDFGKLYVGDTFEHDGKIYIKIIDIEFNEIKYNCVNLLTGEISMFSNDIYVFEVNINGIIERIK